MTDWGIAEFMSEAQRAAQGFSGALRSTETDVRGGNAPMSVRRSAGLRDDLSVEFCEACGHDRDTHRGNRCWVDWQGLSISRSYTQIACDCERFQ